MKGQTASFARTYGGAAWLVVLGVLMVWMYLKNTSAQQVANLPDLPDFSIQTSSAQTESTYLKQAEVAFASGRVTRPKGDSALDHYRTHLTLFPTDIDAQDGIAKVVAYLVNAAETAARQNDWRAAEEFAEQILEVSTNHVAALSIKARVQRNDAISSLLETARSQLTEGQLTKPEGSNALATFQAILALEPDHADAKQGIEVIAQRLTSLAQTEVFADRIETARDLMAKAKEISPNSPGIDAAEQIIQEWQSMTNDQAVQQSLQAASLATQTDRLIATDGKLGALDYYQAALRQDPESEAAQLGIEHTLDLVLDRAWTELIRENLPAAATLIDVAGRAGGDVTDAKKELEFLKRLQRLRTGNFANEDYIAISQLSVRRQVQPEMKASAQSGSVVLEFTVNEEGNVGDIEVTSAGSAELASAAKDALGKWRFDPHTIDGRAIPVRTALRLRIEN